MVIRSKPASCGVRLFRLRRVGRVHCGHGRAPRRADLLQVGRAVELQAALARELGREAGQPRGRQLAERRVRVLDQRLVRVRLPPAAAYTLVLVSAGGA